MADEDLKHENEMLWESGRVDAERIDQLHSELQNAYDLISSLMALLRSLLDSIHTAKVSDLPRLQRIADEIEANILEVTKPTRVN